MITRFWHLASPATTKKHAEWEHASTNLETVICPADEGHQRAGARLTNLNVTLAGNPVDDFVWTWYGECLIRDNVLNDLKANEYTGFEARSANLRFNVNRDERPPKIWEVVVTGFGGMASAESGISPRSRCPACGYTAYSGVTAPEKIIDESHWDGSDMFIVWPLPRYIFITDRLAHHIRDAGWKGYRLLAISEIHSDGFTPGRLSYFMPDQRAKKLGEPLGIY
jgi:Protein of unknown function (Gmx_para_CXXCG)